MTQTFEQYLRERREVLIRYLKGPAILDAWGLAALIVVFWAAWTTPESAWSVGYMKYLHTLALLFGFLVIWHLLRSMTTERA